MNDVNPGSKTFVIDIDGTICPQTDGGDAYFAVKPYLEVIKCINTLYRDGHVIVFFTARGMKRYSGDLEKIEIEYRQKTERWLADNDIRYNQLIFGKPAGDIYIDDLALRPNEFRDIIFPQIKP